MSRCRECQLPFGWHTAKHFGDVLAAREIARAMAIPTDDDRVAYTGRLAYMDGLRDGTVRTIAVDPAKTWALMVSRSLQLQELQLMHNHLRAAFPDTRIVILDTHLEIQEFTTP